MEQHGHGCIDYAADIDHHRMGLHYVSGHGLNLAIRSHLLLNGAPCWDVPAHEPDCCGEIMIFEERLRGHLDWHTKLGTMHLCVIRGFRVRLLELIPCHLLDI